MTKEDFISLLSNRDFHTIFTESGWNNPSTKKPTPITLDEKTFVFKEVVSYFARIYVCEVENLPLSSEQRALDTRLRKTGVYIAIYVKKDEPMHHLWVVPVNLVDKRTLVKIEYSNANQANFLYQKMAGLSFPFGSSFSAPQIIERINQTFAVNATQVTKQFYEEFRKKHNDFVKGILNIVNDKDRDWYASVMLNRLMFCYFIQKKGFLNFDTDYLRNKLKDVQEKHGCGRFYGTFYRAFLRRLFFDGLNTSTHSAEFEADFGRIPYLNGGMFDTHKLEDKYTDIDIPDEVFEKLFNFFDQWQWHLDTSITASGKDINPDVLGYIFEQYINDRAAMGAYYTKEDITEYIGKNCILPFLFDRVAESSSRADFKPSGFVWQTLKASAETYVYDAVKKGYTSDWREKIPKNIACGLDTTKPDLLKRRAQWNTPTDEDFALPTEIWRETIERLTRCEEVLAKIANGQITEINDFITYNLNIRAFAQNLLEEAPDHHFVANFYHALQRVTILDPTCGSGAFLFAALNILEPLYEVCITRMQEFQQKNKNLFKDELAEIDRKYRSNIQYFIYKSIILRNLYGVDIMAEATEIAKLRLFLKMVAVVDVNPNDGNLGLDPLPDIDFNIRCGNTLVGYATEQEFEDSLINGDMYAMKEFEAKIKSQMSIVAKAYATFKDLQMLQDDEHTAFKKAKNDLRERLVTLNETLNHHLYGKTPDSKYPAWLASHQPFHWLAEFYEIIHSNGGFDVIIGNPPYVVYTKSKAAYEVGLNYKTIDCSNLYAYCIERSYVLLSKYSRFGMIVPNSSISASKMKPLQEIMTIDKNCWVTNYSWRPSKLFEGADMLLAVILNETNKGSVGSTYSSCYRKWYNEYRSVLFKNINYVYVSDIKQENSIPKIPNLIALSILKKISSISNNTELLAQFNKYSKHRLYYFRAVQYWFKVLDKEPIFEENGKHQVTGEMKPIYMDSRDFKYATISILSSSLFFLYYVLWSSCQVVNSRDFKFFIDFKTLHEKVSELATLGEHLQEDYQKNSHVKERHYSKKGRVFTMKKQHFFIKHSKPIIDEIDKVLAKHYGFTEEELDFIINYDIKYRMGDGLNGEE